MTLTERFLSQTTLRFPIFHHLRDFTGQKRRSRRSSTPRAGLDLLKHTRIIYPIDGVDEVLKPYRTKALNRIFQSERSETIIIGCRSDVLSEMGSEIDGVLDEIVELNNWDYEHDVLPFAKSYFAKTNLSAGFESFLREQ